MRGLLVAGILLLAGCVGAALDDPGAADASAALDAVTMEGGTIAARDASSVTLRWEGDLDEPAIAPAGRRVLLGGPTETSFAVPVGAFFAVDVAVTSPQIDLVVFVSNAEEMRICSARSPTLAPCGGMMRVDDPRTPEWRMRVLADESWPGPVTFVVDVRVRLVEPANGGLPAIPAHDALRFGAPVSVAPDVGMHEPSLDITPEGTIYVTGYSDLAGGLWRSVDGGASFARVPVIDLQYCNNAVDEVVPPIPGPTMHEGTFHWGCGDVDVAVSGEETVYFAHHWNGEAVHASHDGGRTWTTDLAAANEFRYTDRAWLAADGMEAWLAFNSGRRAAPTGWVHGDTVVSRTIDGGRTWLQVGQITQSTCLPGGFVHSPADGRLYMGGCDEETGPTVAVSSDRGLSWDWHVIAQRSGDEGDHICYTCGIYTVIDTDAEGNVYAVWADPSHEGTMDVWYATSTPGGAQWTEPIRLTTAPGTHLMPWIVAGDEGHAVVAWYGTTMESLPAEAENAVWYVHAAETRDGLAPEPAWIVSLVSETPVRYGPICISGSACESGRNLGDYFQVALGPEARPVVAYSDGRAGGTWTDGSRVMVARAG